MYLCGCERTQMTSDMMDASFCSGYSRLVMHISYRIIHGMGKPDEVLECIERGVDIFESFFPFQVTERGCALVFGYDYQPGPEAAGRLFP